MRIAARLAAIGPLALLAGCEGVQTALGGDGAHSQQVNTLFLVFFVVTVVFYLLVIGFLGAAIFRRRRSTAHVADDRTHHRSDALLQPALLGWAALVTVGLAALAISSFFVDRSQAAANGDALEIRLTGNQWWWDVEYLSDDPSQSIRTANELHLPLNSPVRIELHSNDVIHSFWVPNLAGKQDLIPGRTTDIHLLPRKIGLFRGQCAEFCGVQHAHMALDVTVEGGADFDRWRAAQLATARPPQTPQSLAGFNYVTTRECRMCHTIAGTTASARIGPDLTHFASRRSIAAGTMSMKRGNLYAWMADPQSQKPGTHMPTVGLEPQELHSIVAYLESLK